MTQEKLTTTRENHLNRIGGPFGIILNPAGDLVAMAGSRCQLTVTIINQGDRAPLVNVMIDERSQPVRQWCINPDQRLALGEQQSNEVMFEFQLPLDSAPGYYDYSLVIDAPDHYPEDTPILIVGQVQVQPYVQEGHLASDPTFALAPPTTATEPAQLQPGQALELVVTVLNRSERVDRFRLACPDLDADWVRIFYPDGFAAGGILLPDSSLELNPGDRGEIRLMITPPLDTKAGVYTPTIYLRSANNPDLVLLDLVYLRVLPVYLLTSELVVMVSNIAQVNGQYILFLNNEGNTDRRVEATVTSAKDGGICTFTVSPAEVFLPPGGTGAITLDVEPKQRWKQPFYGRVIEFALDLRDLDDRPLLVRRFPGSMVWDGRPWWQFLLLILTALGLIGALLFALWLMLPRPPRSPEIVEFYPQRHYYNEEDNQAVRLNWQVAYPERLMTIQVQGISPEGLVLSRPVIYEFEGGIPEALAPYCQLEGVLRCINVPTDARQPGDYRFELITTPIPSNPRGLLRRIWRTRLQVARQETNVVRITGIPIPTVRQFAATQSTYNALAAPNPPAPVVPDSSPEPEEEEPIAFNAPVFSLQSPGENGDPRVVINPELLNPDRPPEPETFEGILLDWAIAAPRHIQELRLVGRDSEGLPVTDVITYNFQEGIPLELSDYCGFTTPTRRPGTEAAPAPELVCNAVPTNLRTPGTYTFELTVIPTQPLTDPPEPTVTDPIKIIAAPIEIVSFTINDQEALPKYVLVLEGGMPSLLTIAWQVMGSGDLTVELLPSPGTVPAVGAISYPLSREPGVDLITLQARDSAGNEVSRTVAIEKVLRLTLSFTVLPWEVITMTSS
ncbi:MAG: hypothetical protein EA366_06580, partial [Spirulina sp. DLM2.Bin59]